MSMYRKGRGDRVKKDDGEETQKAKTDEVKVTSALLRLTKDFTDIDIPKHLAKLTRDDKVPMDFSFTLTPDTGYWKGGSFEFQFKVPNNYPFREPKVTCVDKIYHPNINYEGAVCVNVLRPWKSTYTIQMILFGLLFLFTDANPMDVLEKEPAEVLRRSPAEFARNVQSAMRGGYVGGQSFPRNRGYRG